MPSLSGEDAEALLRLAQDVASGFEVDWSSVQRPGGDPALQTALDNLKIVARLAAACSNPTRKLPNVQD